MIDLDPGWLFAAAFLNGLGIGALVMYIIRAEPGVPSVRDEIRRLKGGIQETHTRIGVVSRSLIEDKRKSEEDIDALTSRADGHWEALCLLEKRAEGFGKHLAEVDTRINTIAKNVNRIDGGG